MSSLLTTSRRSLAVLGVLSVAAAAWAGPVAASAQTGPSLSHPAAPSRVLSVGTPTGLKLIHPPPQRPQSLGKVSQLYLHTSGSQGVVAVKPKVYLVFWGSQWSTDPAKAKPALQAFFKGLHGSADPWGAVLDQYCQGLAVNTVNCGSAGTHIKHPTSTPLAGVWNDNAGKEPNKATGAQLAAEAAAAATHFGNTTQTSNLDTQYVIASAHGTHPDGFPGTGFCAWHNSAGTSDGTIAYTNLPYLPDNGAGSCTTIGSPTLLDGYFSTETHEYAETVTDMWPSNGWLDSSGAEIGDKCQNLDAREKLSTGTFDVQGIWSNVVENCVTSTSAIWTGQATQPQGLSNDTPALAYFGSDLYAAWRGTSGNQVFYSAFNGTNWSSQATIGGTWGSALTSKSPALAAANGVLYAAWTGQTAGDLYYSTFDGTSWSAQAKVSGSWGTAKTDQGPALGDYNGTTLWVAWKGHSNSNVYFSAPQSGTWIAPTKVPGASTALAPALIGTPESSIASFAFAWTTSSGHIDTRTVGGLGWAGIQTVPQALTHLGPAMALVDNNVFFAWKASGSGTKVWYSDALDYQGSGDTWATAKSEPQAGTNDRPALASRGSTLTAAWIGTIGSHIFYAMTTNPY